MFAFSGYDHVSESTVKRTECENFVIQDQDAGNMAVQRDKDGICILFFAIKLSQSGYFF